MTREEAIKLLKGGPDGIVKWNNLRDAGEEVPDLNHVDLSHDDLSAMVDVPEYFPIAVRARITKWPWDTQYQCGVNLEGANLSNANLANANLHGARLWEANLTGACLRYANLTLAGLNGANLAKAQLTYANLTGADLSRANLTDAKFWEANLTRTGLELVRFEPEHQVFFDGSHTIKVFWWDRCFGWSRLRKIGRFPLFGISWGAFLLALGTIDFLGAMNENKYIERLHYPLHIPHRMMLILLDTIFLVIGSTLYKWFCPERVQEFSQTGWVEQLGRPRLQYLAENWKKRPLQLATFVFSAVGAGLGLYLVFERLYLAMKYILNDLG